MIYSMRDVDTEALARVAFQARQVSERKNADLSVDKIRNALDSAADDDNLKVILCRSDKSEEMLGWLSLHTRYARMVFIGEWHPEVVPSDNYGIVARKLIREAKKATKNMGRERLEVQFNKITSRVRPLLRKYEDWYREEGFRYASEETYMEAAVTDDLPELQELGNLTVQRISEISNDDLMGPFFDSFLESKNGLFLSLTKDQQIDAFNYWFSRSRQFIDEASICVFEKNQVVGFMVVREEDGRPFVGPIGVHPNHRGKGIARTLLTKGINAIRKQGFRRVALEMDILNMPAMNLYKQFEFQSIHNSVYYYWPAI
ncbi:MAG: GNAT family N-acetyltransferase [Candidatus Thorarchaeota archaeon]